MEKKRKMSKKRIVEEDIIEIKRRRREVGHELVGSILKEEKLHLW